MIKEERLKRRNIKLRKIANSKEATIPWSWQWDKIHFHYFSYVFDDNAVYQGEYGQEKWLKARISEFAHARKNYRYSNIKNNTRDLGGYLTSNHQYRVKCSSLIRSENLHNLTPKAMRALKKLNVTKVVDLRDFKEKNQLPDDERIKAPVLLHPVYTIKGVNRSRNLTLRHGVIYRYHSLFFDNQHAMKAYHDTIKDILNNNSGATLYHCVEGRDRTGIISVLLLSALGVDRHTIINDYMLTDYYAYTKPYVRQYKQIICFFNVVKKYYGNIFNYLNALGISDYDIEQLREKFLEPINQKETLDAKNVAVIQKAN